VRGIQVIPVIFCGGSGRGSGRLVATGLKKFLYFSGEEKLFQQAVQPLSIFLGRLQHHLQLLALTSSKFSTSPKK
jgi:hypothetical protein